MEDSLNEMLMQDELFQLLEDAVMVGYSINLNYSTMTIITNDIWKYRAKGIPHNSFLIATAIDRDNLSATEEINEEIILLRVTSEYELPNSDVWLEAKIDKFKNLKSTSELRYDEFSRKEMQYSGLECRVLGTFFKLADGSLQFGSDIENYYGTQIITVYKPSYKSLEKIVNYGIGNNDELKEEIGEIRFTSTIRLQSSGKRAKVYVNPNDFIARRTAMFGMTRTGKSNTVKTLIKAINKTAKDRKMNIAQIIYDINGEYANINVDDKTSIASDLKDAYIFSLNTNVKNKARNVEVLQFNFFENLELTHEVIVSLMRSGTPSTATDIEAFMNMEISQYMEENIEEDSGSLYTRAKWIRATYKYILHNILNVEKGEKRLVRNPFSKSLLKKLIKLEEKDDLKKFINSGMITYDELGEILEAIHRQRDDLKSSSGKKVYRDDFETLLNIAVKKNSQGKGFLGYNHLKKYNPNNYHSWNSGNYIEKICNMVKEGKTIVLDLSIGSEEMRNLISDKIARTIFNMNMETYTKGEEPNYVIFYIEEAHNLIGKEMDLKDTWPRIAKEGAKYKIGLVYSTQEPSSINKNILANTENWFVTHLNNEDELRALCKFYDFVDYKNSLLTAKDVGFSRIKTLSHHFVIPVQIKLYGSDG